MACLHEWHVSEQDAYDVCGFCGTYRSRVAPHPGELYGADYWTPERMHSTMPEQVYNVDGHRENGLTKNEFVLNHIEVGSRAAAIEIGCAPGRLLLQLRGMAGFAQVIGVEAHPSFEKDIRQIGAFGGPLIFGLFPMATSSLPDESFSLVVALDVCEHSHEPEAFLAECSRLLEPEGQVLLMMPLIDRSVEMTGRMFHPREHVYMHSARNMAAMLADVGFTQIAFDRWCPGHELMSGRKP